MRLPTTSATRRTRRPCRRYSSSSAPSDRLVIRSTNRRRCRSSFAASLGRASRTAWYGCRDVGMRASLRSITRRSSTRGARGGPSTSTAVAQPDLTRQPSTRIRASSSPRRSRVTRDLLPVPAGGCRRTGGACWVSPSRPWPRSSWPRRPACAPHLWAWLEAPDGNGRTLKVRGPRRPAQVQRQRHAQRYAHDGSGGLVWADPQVRRRDEDLPQEEQQACEERDHGRDEEQGHRHRRVEAREGPQEQRRDHRTDEQGRDRAERDGAPDQLRPAGERCELDLKLRRPVRRPGGQLRLERSAAIDDAGETIGQHRQHGADAREEKHGRHGELNRMGDRRDAGGLLHEGAQAAPIVVSKYSRTRSAPFASITLPWVDTARRCSASPVAGRRCKHADVLFILPTRYPKEPRCRTTPGDQSHTWPWPSSPLASAASDRVPPTRSRPTSRPSRTRRAPPCGSGPPRRSGPARTRARATS